MNNSLGFRESEINQDILSDTYIRILFLGDSFTFGQGVAKGEDRFSDLVEHRLNATNQNSDYQYFIYNGGICGTAPKDWVIYLQKLVPIYQPKHLFAIFFL